MSLLSLYKKLRAQWKKTSLHPLQKVSLFGIAILAGLTFSVGTLTDTGIERLNSMLSAVLPGTVINLTNIERNERNLSSLNRNPLLDEAARLKAVHMRDNNYFDHYSPLGLSPWYWFDAVGYNYLHAGENLAVFFDDSEEVVRAWMNSPLHRDNILKAEYTDIGVATVEATHKGYKTVFVVQLFGTPMYQQAQAFGTSTTRVPQSAPSDEMQVRSELAIATTPDTQQKVLPAQDTQEPAQDADNTLLGTQKHEGITVQAVTIDDTTVYVAEHIATSSGIMSARSETKNMEPVVGKGSTLHTLYYLLTMMIATLLTISLFIATRRKVYPQIAYGVFLFLLTTAVVFVHTRMVLAF